MGRRFLGVWNGKKIKRIKNLVLKYSLKKNVSVGENFFRQIRNKKIQPNLH